MARHRGCPGMPEDFNSKIIEGFAGYEAKTTRQIPVVLLDRVR